MSAVDVGIGEEPPASFSAVWDAVAAAQPSAEAIVQGARRLRWSDFAGRSAGLAGALQEAGLRQQSKVAIYLPNAPEYLETVYSCFKGSFVPVNTNYRYTAKELLYLWQNADAEAVIFHSSFQEGVNTLRSQLPEVRAWIHVGPSNDVPAWAVPFEDAVTASAVIADPSPDDLLLMYTGGTTGLPKGVMWRQDDLFHLLNRTAAVRYEELGAAAITAKLRDPDRRPSPRQLPCPPLMHGTAAFTAFSALSSGGTVVLLEGRSFDPVEMLDTVERERVSEVAIVGDAFARPLLSALDESPDRWDLSTLRLVVSSGVMWSAEVKAGLLRHLPGALLVDTLGSSEAVGIAASRSSARDGVTGTAAFRLGPNTQILTEDGDGFAKLGEIGMLALRGRGPVGYHKDPQKSARTFRLIDGQRWTVPGDFAMADEDGRLTLLGRGSVCINTGGEKVFPEEVEEALKRLGEVADAVVVGVPDERFGERVVALVEPREGAAIDLGAWQAALREELAPYKVPRLLLVVESVNRAPNGKADYRAARAFAAEGAGDFRLLGSTQ